MVATVIITEKNGVGGAQTNKTGGTIRFKTADNPTVDNAHPVDIPVAGMSYSMEKVIRMEISVAPATQLADVVAYPDESNDLGVGVSLLYRTSGPYSAPAIPADATGLTDLFTRDSSDPIPLDVVNQGPFASVGQIGDHLVLSMQVAPTAQPGPITPESLTFSYTEM